MNKNLKNVLLFIGIPIAFIISVLSVSYLSKNTVETKYYEIVEKNSDVVVSGAENPLEYHAAEMDNQNRCLHILRAVREKNEDWYEMLILFDYFGMSKKEIAERTGFPVSTVDTYLRRCKKWLKARFQDVKEN